MSRRKQQQELQKRGRPDHFQEPSSSSDNDDDEGSTIFGGSDEGAGFGLTPQQMMQLMMMSQKRGGKFLNHRGVGGGDIDADAEDEGDFGEDFPLDEDDEGNMLDGGYDFDGFYDEDDDFGDFDGAMMMDEEEEDDDDNGDDFDEEERVRVLDSDEDNENANNKKNSNNKKTKNTSSSSGASGGGINEHVNVNFSVDNMVKEDIPKVASRLENYFPDPEKSKVDVETLAKIIFEKGVGTSVVLAVQENNDESDSDDDENENDSDDEPAKNNLENDDDDDDPEEEFYGVLSLVGNLPESTITKPAETILFKEVLDSVSAPSAVHPMTLLRSNPNKTALVVAELFSHLPPALIARLYKVFVDEIKSSNRKGGIPDYLVFISKITPATAESQDKTPLNASAQTAKQYAKDMSSSNKKGSKKGPKVEEVDEEGNPVEKYVTFLRFEEDLFYRNRDSFGTQVARGRFNNDPSDERRCLCYALTWKNFVSAVEELSIFMK